MSTQLVLIHGRSQEHKDASALKAEWLDALREGLAGNGVSLPIAETQVRFPFYGDTLYDMVAGRSRDEAAGVIVRGAQAEAEERRFTLAVLEEVRVENGISDAQLAEVAGQEIVERGPMNWEWVQAVLRAVDRFVPHASGASLALFTHDVYQYLNNSAIRQQIEDGVATAFTPGASTVVVAHSLGTVVAYDLLRREGHLRGWKVPLFVTLGAPLGISAIRAALRAFAPLRCPPCVAAWLNALDDRDVVALYPLEPNRFPLDPELPAIENKTDIRNRTSNRHGIGGYLDDRAIANRIREALLAR